MKKLASFLIVLSSVVSFGVKAYSQAPLKSYEATKETGEAHVFGGSAQVFELTAGDTLTRLWLDAQGNRDLEVLDDMNKTPEKQSGTELGFRFYFGNKTVTHFGLTAGGFVFFGNEDLYPSVDLNNQTAMKNVGDYVYFALKALNYNLWGTMYWLNPEVVAGEDASVKYEIVEDTLFVGYEGLKVFDKGDTASMEVSFQYAFSADGKIRFTVQSMQPSGTPVSNPNTGTNYFGFSFGLYSSSVNESLFLSDYAEGTTRSGSISTMQLTDALYPQSGDRFTFSLPAACEAISSPAMKQWDVTLTSNSLSLGYYNSWNEGNKALFILSEESELTGGNLPQDGTVYASGDKIGTSQGVALAESNGNYAYFDNGQFTGLKPLSKYYLYVFPYNDDCSGGPKYNTAEIPDSSFMTLMDAPKSVRVQVPSITENSFTLEIDTAENCHYLLAVSLEEIPAGMSMAIEKKAYAAGDKITISSYSDSYELEVIEPNSSALSVTVDGRQAGTDYYCYVWSVNPEGTDYSEVTNVCGVSTVRNLTAEIDFNSAASNSNRPAGWSFDADNDQDFVVVEDMERGKYLAVQSTAVIGDDYQQKASWSAAVSPVVSKGDYDAVSAIVDLYYYASSWMGSSSSRPGDGDTLYIQYKDVDGEQWTDLYAVTREDEVALDGALTIEVPEFEPTGNFQFRFISVSSTGGAASATPYVAICKITVEPVLSCKKVTDLVSDPSGVSFDKALLKWEDANPEWAESFRVRYRESDSSKWLETLYFTETQAQLDGLKENTSYVAEVTAVCGANDTALSRELEFSTVRTLPYRLELVEGNYGRMSMPADVYSKIGILPEEGFADLKTPDETLAVWDAAFISEDGMNGNYGIGIQDISYANNPMWLQLPTLAVGDLRGVARISMKLSGSYMDMSTWTSTDPSFSSADLFKVLVSSDGNFSKESVVDTVDLSALTLKSTNFVFDFEVSSPVIYVALFTDFDQENLLQGHSFFIDSLKVDWLSLTCDPVSSIRQSNLTKTSIDLSWKGESLEYAVVYKPRAEEVTYDTLFTEETSCTLEKLKPGTAYEYFILGYCEENRQNPSEPSETKYFNTVAECVVPTIEVIDGSVTWQSVRFAMSSPEKTRLINIYAKEQDKYPDINYFVSNNDRDTLKVTGLMAAINIPYYAKVRAICAIGDSSDWSETVEFTTEPLPNCGKPSSLTSEVDIEKKTANLSWKNGENNLYQVLMIKEASASKFDTTFADGNTFTVYNVKLNTAYTWKLMACCEESLLYSETAQAEFSTETSSSESVRGFGQALRVRVSDNQIIVENPEKLYIESIEVFSVNGKLQRNYSAKTDENVFVYHDLQPGMALIRVIGADNHFATYKVVII